MSSEMVSVTSCDGDRRSHGVGDVVRWRRCPDGVGDVGDGVVGDGVGEVGDGDRRQKGCGDRRGEGVVGDGVGDVGDGVVGDGVGEVGDGVVGDGCR